MQQRVPERQNKRSNPGLQVGQHTVVIPTNPEGHWERTLYNQSKQKGCGSRLVDAG